MAVTTNLYVSLIDYVSNGRNNSDQYESAAKEKKTKCLIIKISGKEIEVAAPHVSLFLKDHQRL